jgi:hypothetical protein
MDLLRFSCPALALFAASLLPACTYGDDRDSGNYYPDPGGGGGSGTIEQATIDTDQLLDVEPGTGAGVFVEYESGGTYHVTTSCDYTQGVECLWDVVITPLDDAPVTNVSPFDLEKDDTLTFGAVSSLRLITYTTDDFDGFSFQTDPGAAVELDAFLDDGAANKFMFWVGDGAVHNGAPSNPVDLVPSEK